MLIREFSMIRSFYNKISDFNLSSNNILWYFLTECYWKDQQGKFRHGWFITYTSRVCIRIRVNFFRMYARTRGRSVSITKKNWNLHLFYQLVSILYAHFFDFSCFENFQEETQSFKSKLGDSIPDVSVFNWLFLFIFT